MNKKELIKNFIKEVQKTKLENCNDGKGNLIRKLNFSNLHDTTSVFWDGANENNTQVTPGIYYVSAKANDKMMAGKLIKH